MSIEKNKYVTPLSIYKTQASNCNSRTDRMGRSVKMKLTFEQWWKIWQDSGKWEQRGKRKGQYCMCRKNDNGNYTVKNVRIDLTANNVREATAYRTRIGLAGHSVDLTDDERTYIKRALMLKQATQAELARRFGISQPTVSRIFTKGERV